MEKEVQGHYDHKANETSLKEVIIKLRDWYHYLISKRVTILVVSIVCALLGLTYSFIKKPVYTATTTFVLEESDKGGGLGQMAGLASMVGIDIGSLTGGGGGIFEGDNILELYKSRTMIEKTLLTKVDIDGKKELLVDRFIEFNELRDRWDKKPALKGISFAGLDTMSTNSNHSRLQDSLLGTIVTDINKDYLLVIKPDQKLSIIKAEVKATDEYFAKAFNEQIVKHVNDFYIQTKTKRAMLNVSIMQDKTDSVRKVMNGAIYTAAAVNDATPNLNITRQVQRIVPVQRSQFTAESNKAILTELVKNLELSKISLLKETPLIQVVDAPIYPLDRKRFGKLKGIVVGGVLGGFLCVLWLLARRMIKEILA